MYDYFKGILVNKNPQKIVLEVNSIGYLFEVSSRMASLLPDLGQSVKIFCSLLHKEDSMRLCGFLNREEREIFTTLISVSGIGVKAAYALLDEFSGADLISAVIAGDYRQLSKAKGIGQKTAQKIIFELREKFSSRKEDNEDILLPNIQNKASKEAEGVLLSLGYEKNEIKKALEYVFKNEKSEESEIILREALKFLATNQE